MREAIEQGLQRQHIRDQLAQKGLLTSQRGAYPMSQEELLLLLSDLENQIMVLRDRIRTETRISVLLHQLGLLRERAQTCLYIAEILEVLPEAIQLLHSLVSEDMVDSTPFYKAELALNTLLQYRQSPAGNLPKTDVETWREVSQTAVWRQAAHTTLTGIALVIRKVLQALSV